jgi:uncharacterized protein (TIGR02246 family)
MSAQTFPSQDSSADENEVRAVYEQLLSCWNKRDASGFAALFHDDGNSIGFDGSQLNGQAEIKTSLGQIFAHHQTPAYVGKIREVRFLNAEVAILRAVAGMTPPGASDIDPKLNAIQTLVASKVKKPGEARDNHNKWRIALFQNTPAQFHGRPELVEQLTEELRQLSRDEE